MIWVPGVIAHTQVVRYQICMFTLNERLVCAWNHWGLELILWIFASHELGDRSLVCSSTMIGIS